MFFENPRYGKTANATALSYVEILVLQEKQDEERNCLTIKEHLECLAVLSDIHKGQ